MGLVDHWSYSAIQNYLDCPFEWYNTYVLHKRPKEKHEAFEIGEALHHVLEVNALKTLSEGTRYTLEESTNLFKQKWDKSHDLLVKTYYRSNFWLVPLGKEYVEWAFELNCLGVPLKGRIDIVTADRRVVDYKTSSSPYSTSQVQESLQLSLYAGAYFQEFKELPLKVGYQVVMKDFSGVQQLWDDRSHVQILKAIELVKQCDDEVNNKQIFEKKRGWRCGHCVYKDVCRNDY